MKLSDLIRKKRIERKMTQKELAHALDINYVQLNKYERGKNVPPSDILVSIARQLKLRDDFFVIAQLGENAEISDRTFTEMLLEFTKNKYSPIQKRSIIDFLENMSPTCSSTE